MQIAKAIGIAHLDRIVDDDQLDLEFLAVGGLPDLTRLGAVIGQDNRRPAGPNVDRETNRFVFEWLVGRDFLDRRQRLGRNVFVFFDGRDRLGIGAFRRLVELLRVDRTVVLL